MSEAELRIRNLTSNTIRVERYEIHDKILSPNQNSRLGKFIKNATPRDPDLVCAVQNPVNTELDPWTLRKIKVEKARLPQQILCIFFNIEGEGYQANILHNRCHSQYLMPSDGCTNPKHKHITLYHPDHHHLTIAFRDSYKSWMQSLRDDIPLSSLSIPGTHNSPTYHKALPSVRCQCAHIRDQLRKGVRFLDVRIQAQHHRLPLRDGLLLVHSAFPISLTGSQYFRAFVDHVLAFLKENPSETVIMSVKREGTGSSNDEHLSRLLHQFYTSDHEQWFTAPRVPYLGEVRGKIVLIRRFHLDESLKSEWGGTGWGIDGSSWADNCANALCSSGDLQVQDFYEVTETQNIEQKLKYSTDHLKRAAASRVLFDSTPAVIKQPFFVNFLTASNFWKMGCWPERIAEKLNPAVVDYLCLEHDIPEGDADVRETGSTGIVVCDWVGHNQNWDIVRAVVGMNARFEKGSSPVRVQ